MSKTIRKLAATKLPRLYGFLLRVFKRFTSSSLHPNKSRLDDQLKMSFKQYVTSKKFDKTKTSDVNTRKSLPHQDFSFHQHVIS